MLDVRVRSIVKFEPYMAFGPSMEAQIEKQMMGLGSGVITDLDRFLMPNLDDCDIYGREIQNGGDYFGGSAYDYEPWG